MSGYTTELQYTSKYFPLWSPSQLRLACLVKGIQPPEIENACELGFGQGVTLNLAASVTHTRWYGTDFNAEQVNNAQSFSEQVDNDVCLYQLSFEEFAKVSDLPKFDLIVLHGIYSWISEENQSIIRDFINSHLSENGMVYISYNAQPGTDAFRPTRHLMKMVFERLPETCQTPEQKIQAIFQWLENFHNTEPRYLEAFSTLSERLKSIRNKEISYLFHEYLNDDWHGFYFSEMAKDLSAGNLRYLGQASFTDEYAPLNLTDEQKTFLKTLPSPMDEDVKDSMTNCLFRKDLWIKNPQSVTPEALEGFFSKTQVMSIRIKKVSKIVLRGQTRQVEFDEGLYKKLYDYLADYQPKTLNECLQYLNTSQVKLIKAVALLNASGYIGLIQEGYLKIVNKAQAFNQNVLEDDKAQFRIRTLALPKIGCGLNVDFVFLLLCKGYLSGNQTESQLADYFADYYQRRNWVLKKGSESFQTRQELIVFIRPEIMVFFKETLPFLKAHAVFEPLVTQEVS